MSRDPSFFFVKWTGKRPPAVLSPEFREVVELDPNDAGWPAILLMPPAYGVLTVLWWDELERQPANESMALSL